jgi:hypothetical protein
VVFLIGTITAAAAGVLAFLAGSPLPEAVLAAGAAFGASVTFAHSIID